MCPPSLRALVSIALAFCPTLVHAAEPPTVAVIDFTNNSLTDRATYDPLSQGLAAALSTQLSTVEGMEIVERSRIRQVAQELSLQMSGMVDDATAGRIGHIVGARYLLLGSYMVMGKKVRIDVRMVETETSRLQKAEQVTGKTSDLLDLIERLADAFAAKLGAKLGRPGPAGVSEAAFAHYSMGVRLEDAGDLDMATREYGEALKSSPDFEVAADALQRVQTQLRIEARVTLARAMGRHTLDGGRDAAREWAINDALRNAIHNSTRRLMGPDSVAFHATTIQENTISRAREYIRDFTVSSERDSAGTMIVEVEAQVARGVLEDDLVALGILYPAWAHPRVMVVAEEDASGAEYQMPGGGREPTYTEAQIQGLLTRNGFRVIDVAQYRRALQVLSPGRSPQDLAAYVLTQGGDLVILGRVAISGGGAIGSYSVDNVRSSTAEGFFQVLRADNGQVIGTVDGRGVGADPQAVQSGLVAIQKMCDEVGPKLQKELVRLAREEVYGRRIIAFEVRGVRSQADLTTIEGVLRGSVDGVLGVVERGRQHELARFEITYEGHPSELAREINRVPFKDLRVIVEESGLGMIRARIQR